MGYLDSFTLVKPGETIKRPGRGVKRITVSRAQITFSKDLLLALGLPRQVKIYYDRDGKRVAVTPARRGGIEFCRKKDMKEQEKKKQRTRACSPFSNPSCHLLTEVNTTASKRRSLKRTGKRLPFSIWKELSGTRPTRRLWRD